MTSPTRVTAGLLGLLAPVGIGVAAAGLVLDIPSLGVAGAVIAAVPTAVWWRRARSRADAEPAHPREAAVEPITIRPALVASRPLAVPQQLASPIEPVVIDSILTGPDLPRTPIVGRPGAESPAWTDFPGVSTSVISETMREVAADQTSDGRAVAVLKRVTVERVDTAELQLIWDQGEGQRRIGHGRRVRPGVEPDALPDRPPRPGPASQRARHRAITAG